MQRLRSVLASFERLSAREKGLIIGAATLFVGIILFFTVFAVSASIGSLEEEVQRNRDALAQIHVLAEDYREVARKRKEIQRRINENPINSLRIPINTIAKGITVESSDPAFSGRGKRLADLISYGGKTVETRIESKKKQPKKRNRDEEEPGNFEIEQSLEFSEVPIPTLYKFLEDLKRSDELIFTRRLEVTRRFNNTSNAGPVSITVSTIKFREPGGTM